MKTAVINNKLCVSISDKSINFAKNKFWDSRFLLELRLDLMSYKHTKDFYACPAYIIITCKDNNEKKCLSIYRDFIKHKKPFAVDIEFNYLKNTEWKLFFDFIKNNNIKSILSFHNYNNTPDYKELADIYKQIFSAKSDFIKIVTTGQTIKDLQIIEKLYDDTNDNNLIAFLMGYKALESRINAIKKNAPWIYVAPTQDITTALNQPDYYTVKKLLETI